MLCNVSGRCRELVKHEDEGASPKMAKRLEAILDIGAAATSISPRSTTVERAEPTPAAETPTRGKTQYFTATSIDGYIADPDNSLDWLHQAHDEAHGEGRWEAFIGAVGAMAMGATTYEWVLEHEKLLDEPTKWHEFYDDIPCWIFTHRELTPIPGADLWFVQGDVRPVHEEMIAAAGGENVWLVGGGDLVGQFADQGLLDEIQLHVAPVTLGAGAPVLPRRITSSRLALRGAEEDGGFAYLTYEVVGAPDTRP